MGPILHVVPHPESTGGARQAMLLAPGLADAGWETHVATLREGWPCAPKGAALVPPASLRDIPRSPRGLLALRRLLAEVRPALVHVWGGCAPRVMATLVRCLGGPRVLVSDLPPVRRLGRLAQRLLCAPAALVAGGPAEAAALREAGFRAETIAIIPPCVAPVPGPDRAQALTELGLPKDARVIACAGRIEAGRGFLEAAWIFDILKYVYSDAWLLVLGDGKQRRRVEQFVRSLGREDIRVRFAGFRPDAPELLGLAEVVWVLGERGGRYVALEALAAGCPVVARQRADLAEILGEGETGYLVAGADKHEVARSTRRILDDAAQKSRFSAAARARAEQFLPERIVPRWADLYARLCSLK